MVYAFRIISPALANGTPASDMDGHIWTFQDQTLESATSRALRRLEQTFCYASRDRVEATSLDLVGEYASRRAYEESIGAVPTPAESGVAPTLTQALAERGYTHRAATNGAHEIVRTSDGAVVTTLKAAAAWKWLRAVDRARAARTAVSR